MSADLLGDHWDDRAASFTVLRQVAKTARYAAARTAALHGLSMLLRRATVSCEQQAIADVLRTTAASDRNVKVRHRAAFALEKNSRVYREEVSRARRNM